MANKEGSGFDPLCEVDVEGLDIEVPNKSSILVSPWEITDLNHVNLEIPIWNTLKSRFYSKNLIADKGVGALLNASITQKRVVFAYSRSQLGEMLKNDPNIPERKSDKINSEDKNKIISQAIHLEQIKVIETPRANEKGRRGTPGILEVTSPAIRTIVSRLLNKPIEDIVFEQLQEAVGFIHALGSSVDRKLIEVINYELKAFFDCVGNDLPPFQTHPPTDIQKEGVEFAREIISEVFGDKKYFKAIVEILDIDIGTSSARRFIDYLKREFEKYSYEVEKSGGGRNE